MKIRLMALVAVLLAVVAAGCGDDKSDQAESSATSAPALSGSITVSAAASLTDAFEAIRDDFTDENPDVEVTLNFGSSGTLSTQIAEGAPADVAAFADTTPMKTLEDAGLLAAPSVVFARNQLVVVTKPANPEGVSSLADLADAGVVSLCVETAPCGKFAGQILQRAGVAIPADRVTRGADVRATLSAVSEGDAVAGIVYLSDAAAVGDRVDTVEIPEADNVVANYPIAVLGSTAHSEAADAFVAFVLSEEGQAVLKESGFLTP